MQMMTCPHCNTRVYIAAEGCCPSCRRLVTDADVVIVDDNAGSPSDTVRMRTSTPAMTTAEKIYTAFVLLCGGFLLLSLASFHFVIIPKMAEPQVMYFVVSVIWLAFVIIATSAIINLCYRSLLVIPTILQCVVLCVVIYFLPFGIWGGVLLYKRIQRERVGLSQRS